MREIKFRIWDNERKEMCKPASIKTYMECDAITIPEGEEQFIMQYTGLKDKNGKECYEGDIVLHKGRIYWLEWVDYRFKFWRNTEQGHKTGGHPFHQMFNHPENFEIIGNIYENPELIT